MSKNKKGDGEDKSAVTKSNKSLKINLQDKQDYDKLYKILDNPPETSDYTKKNLLVKQLERIARH